MQKGLRAPALRHGFLQPEAHLLSQLLHLGRGILFLRLQLLVFQWILASTPAFRQDVPATSRLYT
jgi:hypothetical protein